MPQFGFRMHGIYYDDPTNLEDPTKFRFILGFDVEENLTPDLVNQILEADPSLKHTKIPISKCCRLTFPTRSQLSIYFAAKNSYPGLNAYLGEHKMWKSGMAFVERYDFHFK